MISGIVGNQAGSLFFDYINKKTLPSAKEILLNYRKHEKTLKSLQLHELSIVNESLFRFMETGLNDDKEKEKVKKSLPAYLEMLEREKKNEVFAHWSSLFSGGNYPDTVIFIVSERPELLVKIQNFVAGI